MTAHSERARQIADKLTKAETDVQLARDLTANWDAFSDADPLPYPAGNEGDVSFPERLEEAGYAELVAVDDDALEDPFAYERGIVRGGMMWSLTDLGLQVRQILQESPQ